MEKRYGDVSMRSPRRSSPRLSAAWWTPSCGAQKGRD
jgi:hypothetical protein